MWLRFEPSSKTWLFVGGFLVIFFIPVTLAQSSDAKCISSDFTWAFNSLGQSPCLLAAYLLYPCFGELTIDPIKPNDYYAPLDPGTLCECNSVVYSAFSVCGACQNGTQILFANYTGPCGDITPHDAEFPFPVPSGTAIPKWAYQSFENTDSFKFNISLAKLVGDSPENTTTATLSSLSSSSLPSTTTST